MYKRQRRYPPKRICPACGGEYYAWQVTGVCTRCRRDTADRYQGVAEDLRQARLERWQKKGLPAEAPNVLEPPDAQVIDDIPY